MTKRILLDASSAILLFKSGWMEALLERYRVVTGPGAFREMTVRGYSGAAQFERWHGDSRITIHSPPTTTNERAADWAHLDLGERDCIDLYHAGAGAFILIDDGPAAVFCRRNAIPYVNALLVPRLLGAGASAPGAEVIAAMQTIFKLGRYAPWVMEYALNCPCEGLSLFLP